MRPTTAVLALASLAASLAACSRGEPDLLTVGASGTPDEFMILPTKPLQAPPDFASLPSPTPGAVNLVDPRPREDAAAALGGRPAILARPTGDAALVGYAARNGIDPTIRGDLAAGDIDFRQSNRGRLLDRLFGVNRYFTIYQPMSLDQRRELERLRAAGLRTPAAPPPLE